MSEAIHPDALNQASLEQARIDRVKKRVLDDMESRMNPTDFLTMAKELAVKTNDLSAWLDVVKARQAQISEQRTSSGTDTQASMSEPENQDAQPATSNLPERFADVAEDDVQGAIENEIKINDDKSEPMSRYEVNEVMRTGRELTRETSGRRRAQEREETRAVRRERRAQRWQRIKDALTGAGDFVADLPSYAADAGEALVNRADNITTRTLNAARRRVDQVTTATADVVEGNISTMHNILAAVRAEIRNGRAEAAIRAAAERARDVANPLTPTPENADEQVNAANAKVDASLRASVDAQAAYNSAVERSTYWPRLTGWLRNFAH